MPERGVMAQSFDPIYLIRQMGYKDRASQISFDLQKRFTEQLSLVSAIIQVRSSQVASFSQPFRFTRTLGFQVRHKDRDHKLTAAEKEVIKKFELMFSSCGRGPNKFERGPRPDFEDLLKMSTRYTLRYDQDTLEIIPERRGVPYSWRQVDASLIRNASNNVIFEKKAEHTSVYGNRVPVYEASFIDALSSTEYEPGDVLYVQVIRDQITAVFTEQDMLFSIRNPVTDIQNAGYGYSEIEMLVNTLTSHLNSERYNYNQFRHGSDPEGVLNIKDENFDPEQLEAFRRQWRSEIAGVENAFKMPILQAADLQFVPMGRSQKEAEFMQWMEYLTKLTTGVYLIDPDEVNMFMGRGAASTPMYEASNENRIKFSKDKGLRPLLRFQAKKMQKILDQIDDHFMFEFVGLDELSEQEKLEKSRTEMETFKTVNEVRAEQDMPPLENGDVPANPTYIQWTQIKMQEAQQQQQAEMEAQQQQQAQQFASQYGQQPGQEQPGAEQPAQGQPEQSTTGSNGGVPVGYTTGANPRVKYANENTVDSPNKSLTKSERRIELIIEDE
jgi:hypothetical protein